METTLQTANQVHQRRTRILPAIISVLTIALAISASLFVTHLVSGATISQGNLASWNPNVSCAADSVTIQSVLGSAYPSQSLTGSPYQTSSASGGAPNKRALSPPCTITNTNRQTVSSFVQVSGVTLHNYFYETRDCATQYYSINGGGPFPNGETLCDSTGNIFAVGTSSGYIHIEIDRDWMAKGYAGPSTTYDNNNTIAQVKLPCTISSPCTSTVSIDVQGFVYWDPEGHWELHPLTAWRLSNGSTPGFSMVSNPSSLSVQQGSSTTSTITLRSLDNFSGTVALVSWPSPAIANTTTTSLTPTSVSLTPGGSAAATLTVHTLQSTPLGSYKVSVKATSGSLVQILTIPLVVTSPPPDFSMSVSPTNMTVPIGSSGTATIAFNSLYDFNGTLNLAATIAPADTTASLSLVGPTASFNPTSVVLAANGTGMSTMTVSSSLQTTPGTYTITVTATSGTISHSATMTVTISLL